MSEEKKITVLFSGGFDSTAVIIKYLVEGYSVYPVSVSLSNNENQSKAERYARKAIWEFLHEEFPSTLMTTEEHIWPLITHFIGNGYSQPPIWLYIAGFNSPTLDVAFGWVRGDDVWHHKQDVLDLTKAFNGFKNNKTVVHFPFEWANKIDLLSYYKSRPRVFHVLSTSQEGMPWSLGDDDKCKELQELAEELKKMRPWQDTTSKFTTKDSVDIGKLDFKDASTDKVNLDQSIAGVPASA
jgi:hypothetical protein